MNPQEPMLLFKCHSKHMKIRSNGSIKVEVDIPAGDAKAFLAIAKHMDDKQCVANMMYEVSREFVKDCLLEFQKEIEEKKKAEGAASGTQPEGVSQ